MNVVKIKKYLCIALSVICISVSMAQNVYASSFENVSYDNAASYTELENRIVAESSEQSLMLFSLIAKWNAYGTSSDEIYTDAYNYIEDAKTRFSFISKYNGSLANEVKNIYSQYIKWLISSVETDINTFTSGPAVFIDYVEKGLSDTQNNYLSFKSEGLDQFLNTCIYTTQNKVAIEKIKEGNISEGQSELANTITGLNEIINNSNTPYVIRDYAKAYKNYYSKVSNNDFSGSSALLMFQVYRIQGLIPVGNAYDEMSEFKEYTSLFNQFTDYPSIGIAQKISSKKLKEQIKQIQKQEVYTSKVQKLKKYHYDFLYQLSEYKKDKDIGALTNAYANLDRYYAYLTEYYTNINNRYSGYSSSDVIKEIGILKEKVMCVDPSFSAITDLTYVSPAQKDTNSYRMFAVNKNFNLAMILKVICILFLLSIPIGICVIVCIKIKKNIDEQREEMYDDDDDYM